VIEKLRRRNSAHLDDATTHLIVQRAGADSAAVGNAHSRVPSGDGETRASDARADLKQPIRTDAGQHQRHHNEQQYAQRCRYLG
jgi:hypothetical protein